MKVFLLGFMGSGKSTIGKKLASKMNLEFIDLDKLIESEMECSVQDAFALKGEHYFREQETKALIKVSKQENVLVALGGGTPCFENNFEIISITGISVYLQLEKVDLYNRLSKNRGGRPLLMSLNENELETYINSTLDTREEFYKTADITINGKDFNAEKYQILIEEINTHDK
ncbi:MAG: AAA family ATPase [Flavobacteriales bacterium]|nr:AAA family ATPase [Flavobacteriales bacterium]